MIYNIRKVGVIGSGTMGGGIATLIAGIGLPVVLLDIPARDTKPDSPPEKRNAVTRMRNNANASAVSPARASA